MSPTQDKYFDFYYQKYFDVLFVQARSYIRKRSVAEEIVQETFCVAWAHYETFHSHENPQAYLKTILRNKISEYERSRNRYLKLFVPNGDVSIENIKAPSNPIPMSTSTILETAQKTLTEEEWYLLERFTIYGDSHFEIAQKLGITPEASSKRLERIRKKLESVFPDF